MPPETGGGSLRDTQRAFARALNDEAATRPSGPTVFVETPPVAIGDRLAVYRNNTRQFFRGALELTYPVLLRRVGEQYFRQLVHEFRAAYPSRSGDLHWAGARFPDWLATRLRNGDYAWLADLARLEWACEEAAAARVEPAVALDVLGALPPEALESARLRLQPSLRLVASRWPVWSVWQANQGDTDAGPVDFGIGAQCCACACLDDGVVVYRLEANDHAVLSALCSGATLGEAMTAAEASPDALTRVLGWAFEAGLVVAIEVEDANPSAPA